MDIDKIFDDWDEEEFYEDYIKFDIDISDWNNYSGNLTYVIGSDATSYSNYSTITLTSTSNSTDTWYTSDWERNF